MIVVCEMHAFLLGGCGGMLPRKIFSFTSSQIASDTIWDKFPNNILMTHTYVQ